jgi:hypothetical protein
MSVARLEGRRTMVLGNILGEKGGGMSSKTARVAEGRLYDPRQPATSIGVDTPAWFAWVEAVTTRSFSYALVDRTVGYVIGVMTVRKERRQRGGAYWVVYRRGAGRVQKRYLGRSAMITHARLAEVAREFLMAHRGAECAGAGPACHETSRPER